MCIPRQAPEKARPILAWDGHAMIHQLGAQLVASAGFATEPQLILADVDLELIQRKRADHAEILLAARALSTRSFRRVNFDGARDR